MRNTMLDLGKLFMILGSIFYGVELILGERREYSSVVLVIYLVSIAFMLVGKITEIRRKKNAQ